MARKRTQASSNTAVSLDSQETEPKITASHDEALPGQEGKVILTEDDCPEALATSWSTSKKWLVLTIIFLVQLSMNLNASLYTNAQSGIVREFGVTPMSAVHGAALFLVMYAFGCELWAPWSEEFGRKIVLQGSLFLVNICCLPVGLAAVNHWFPAIIIGRALGGLFSAGGSVTLGMVADLFKTEEQEYPLAFIVLSSVGGSIIGPIMGGYIETNLHWSWAIWIQLLVGVVVQILHLIFVPETRASALVKKHAKKLRDSGERPNVYGEDELKTLKEKLVPSQILSLWARPFKMLLKERIVLILSALSGFSDALIFMQIQSFGRVFKIWNFTTIQVGLAFIPIGIAYIIGFLLYIPITRRNRSKRKANPTSDKAHYESRLWMLLWTAPLLPLGMVMFTWASCAEAPWIVPMIGWLLIGVANYCIYLTTIDYMVAAYGPFSASATGGNGFARDILAGALTWSATPYYDAFKFKIGLQIANTVLAGIAMLLMIAAFFVYVWGPSMRKKSPFAQSLNQGVDRTRNTRLPPNLVA
ncbi:major facilitator superfamily domain-containing protein [Hypoxylon rubiginosum]|uniref:Major facilitator superfamily domain-containing protein n=1 Tax=Hypoxylon rubiginosum TaxID=110542 RepID=A0ACC0D1E8_9PEZI|nr:major facilitator superfamily domain-containing protein [Hypoxylon rubiginosum]